MCPFGSLLTASEQNRNVESGLLQQECHSELFRLRQQERGGFGKEVLGFTGDRQVLCVVLRGRNRSWLLVPFFWLRAVGLRNGL